MHYSSQCPVCSASSSPGSMSDAEFFAFLNTCRHGLAEAQSQFQKRIIGEDQWFYDLADGKLTIGTQTFSITPIGTYNSEHKSWLWAWANDEFPPLALETSKRLTELHAITGFRVFLDPGISASENDAEDFVALAVHCLGAIGFFRTAAVPVLFLAVHERPSAS